MKTHASLLWMLVVLALVAVVGGTGAKLIPTHQPQRVSSGKALIGGHFELEDGTGKTVTEKDFAGRYLLVFFGFTHCPDICPTTLLKIQNLLDDNPQLVEKVIPIFITVDPQRDTPEIMGSYVKHFGDHVVGLSGTAEQIKHAAEAYKVYYAKVEDPASAMGYTMDHSGFLYLMGPDGDYITHFPHTVSPNGLKDGLAKVID